MPNALILAQRFHKHDGRLIRVRAALREAGYKVTSLAFDSGGDQTADAETSDLRPKAVMTLALIAQLILAAIIAGYFLRFVPVGMTILFWLLVGSAVFLASPLGARFREPMLVRLSEAFGLWQAKRAAPDVIWAVDPESLRLASRIKTETGAKLIFDAHEFHREEAPDDDARRQWVIREETASQPNIDHMVTINESIGALYTEAMPGTEPVIVRNAVDPRQINPSDSPLKTAAELEPGTKVLLYHGALRSLRYLEHLVDAANSLPENWRLVVLGDGPMKTALQEGSQKAIFLDPVPYDELPLWIAGADLGAILYEDHGANQHNCSPNKLYEYMAYGVPLLVSDLPELRRYAVDKGCGVLVQNPVTSAGIVEVVSSLSEGQLKVMRKACSSVSESLSWQAEKEKIRSLVTPG